MQFVERLFNASTGVWPYLSDFLPSSKGNQYHLIANDVPCDNDPATVVFAKNGMSLSAVSVKHGPLPAVAWRIDIGGYRIVISGDMNGDLHSIETLAKGADILVAHNAIPEQSGRVERYLHMPASVIGEIAKEAGVKKLVLSHRMIRTLGKEEETLGLIRKSYAGEVVFADDLDTYVLQ